MIVMFLIRRSKLGLAFMSIRDDEQAAQVTGVDTFRYKIISFLISAFIAGLAGGLYAYFRLYFYYTSDIFSHSWTFSATMAVIVGGAGTLAGPMLGAVFLVILGYIFSLTLGQANLIVFGFLFIFVMLFMPQGLMGGVNLFQSWFRRARKAAVPENTTNA
jgi:branched-chain amino acid transport system permease protein